MRYERINPQVIFESKQFTGNRSIKKLQFFRFFTFFSKLFSHSTHKKY